MYLSQLCILEHGKWLLIEFKNLLDQFWVSPLLKFYWSPEYYRPVFLLKYHCRLGSPRIWVSLELVSSISWNVWSFPFYHCTDTQAKGLWCLCGRIGKRLNIQIFGTAWFFLKMTHPPIHSRGLGYVNWTKSGNWLKAMIPYCSDLK